MISRSILVIILFFPLVLVAQNRHQLLMQGDRDYRSGSFSDAEESYKKATVERSDLQGQYNLGNALYQQGRYEEAEEAFQRAIQQAPNQGEKGQAYYNLGNAQFQQQKLQESVE